MTPRAFRRVFCQCLLTLGLSACGESDDTRIVDVDTDSGCESLAPCSIADAACQRAVLEITACVRGDETPARPAIRSLSREGLRRELNESVSATEQDEPSAEATAISRAIDEAFAALHLIAPETTLGNAAVSEQADSIAAFYRPDKKDITVISDTSMERGAAMNALSHEFTHYLQDLAGQLDDLRKSKISLDESVARRALSEGEAVVTSYRATAAMMNINAANVRWDTIWTELEKSITRATGMSKSPLLAASNQLPYVISPPAIQRTWEQRGREEVDELFEAPPLTQLDWLMGTTVPERSNAEPLDCYPALPPRDYQVIASDSLGVAGLFALLSTQQEASLIRADSWRQDRIAIYMRDDATQSDTPHVLAVWRIRFVSEQAAATFAARIAPLDFYNSISGRELLLRVSNDADDEAIALLDPDACPTAQEFAAAPRPATAQASLSQLQHWP